jgi:o-succinylbenzoate---CoA ligase
MERRQLAALLQPWVDASAAPDRVVEEADPRRFMAAFARSVAGTGPIFLANPGWQSAERAELAVLLENAGPEERGWLMIPSGGSGGTLKFARHDGHTVAAAVGGFARHFDLPRVNAVGVLPLHHVSGFMAWMRCVVTGGTYVPWDWKQLEQGDFPAIPEDCCLSLVPTQLQRLLASAGAVAWLRGFRVIFVGGGPSWGGLLDAAAQLGLPLSPGYGATETAAMATGVRPAEFLAGMRGCGAPLPHVAVDFAAGVVRVAGDSLFRGYYPEFRPERSWVTEDLGHFGPDGSLVIEGRRDDVIITGGQKVAPPEVESLLRASGEFDDVAVVGVPDPEWGQAVVACHPPRPRPLATETIDAVMEEVAAYKRPKRYIEVSPWPRNPQGKINRAELARLAALSPPPPSPRGP